MSVPPIPATAGNIRFEQLGRSEKITRDSIYIRQTYYCYPYAHRGNAILTLMGTPRGRLTQSNTGSTGNQPLNSQGNNLQINLAVAQVLDVGGFHVPAQDPWYRQAVCQSVTTDTISPDTISRTGPFNPAAWEAITAQPDYKAGCILTAEYWPDEFLGFEIDHTVENLALQGKFLTWKANPAIDLAQTGVLATVLQPYEEILFKIRVPAGCVPSNTINLLNGRVNRDVWTLNWYNPALPGNPLVDTQFFPPQTLLFQGIKSQRKVTSLAVSQPTYNEWVMALNDRVVFDWIELTYRFLARMFSVPEQAPVFPSGEAPPSYSLDGRTKRQWTGWNRIYNPALPTGPNTGIGQKWCLVQDPSNYEDGGTPQLLYKFAENVPPPGYLSPSNDWQGFNQLFGVPTALPQ